ncbi:MAG: NUDIX domain-containing protein [Ardenticatenaceae bacterium]
MLLSDWHFCPRCATELEHREQFGAIRPGCPACGFVYFADPKVTAGVLVEREKRVLLGKRNVDPRMGFWCLPGGFVDYGERIREAAAREVQEETGLQVDVGDLLGVWDFEENIGDKRGIAIFFLGRAAEGEPVAADDLEEVGWFCPDNLPPIAFPIHEEVLRRWVMR